MEEVVSIMPDYFSWLVNKQVCGMGFPWDKENIRYLLDNNVYYLISLTEEVQPKVDTFPDLNHLVCKIQEFEPPTQEQVEECIEFMEKAVMNKKAVAVHCLHGRGRTGTILACYLVKTRGMAAKDAITYVRRKRPWSVETTEQEDTVYVYEHIIKDSN